MYMYDDKENMQNISDDSTECVLRACIHWMHILHKFTTRSLSSPSISDPRR